MRINILHSIIERFSGFAETLKVPARHRYGNPGLAVMLLCMIGLLGSCHSTNDKVEVPSLDEFLEKMDSESDKDAEEVPEKIKFLSPAEMRAFIRNSEDSSRYRQGIFPLMIEKAPQYASSLLDSGFERFLIADKGKMRVIVYDRFGREVRSFKMAAGKGFGNKQKKGDGCTPEGLFKVEGVYDSTEWLFTDDDGKT